MRHKELQTQQRQQQEQRQQQQHQQEQQHPNAGLSRELPEKQHQPKHNPISEATKVAQRTCDQ
jgi:hypothetical protein